MARENLTDHLEAKDKTNKIRQRLLKIRAKKVILATGALERPLIFNNNDRPGIILSSAIKKYNNYYGVACGTKTIFFTNNDSAYESALSLNDKGIKVEAVVDIRKQSETNLEKRVIDAGIKIYWEHTVVDTSGYKRLNNVSIMKLSNDGTSVTGNKISISCDCLGVAGGWTPAVHLYTQSGSKLAFDEDKKIFIPNKNNSDQISVGSCCGDFKLDEILKNLNEKLKDFLDINKTDFENITVNNYQEISKRNIWLLPSDKALGKTKPFVDYQNDATAKDIKLALREGFRSIEHVKRLSLIHI